MKAKKFGKLRRLLLGKKPRPAAVVALLLAGGLFLMLLGLEEQSELEFALQTTRTRLERTESRLKRAEYRDVAREARVREAEQRLHRAEARLDRAMVELDSRIDERLGGMEALSQRQYQDISLQVSQTQESLEQAARLRLQSLREEMASELVAQLEEMKVQEQAMLSAISSQVTSARKESEAFKETFSRNRDSILFIRTDYQVVLASTGERRTFTSFGTGFLISPVGVGMTARHVIYPWLFNRKLKALQTLGLAQVVPDSLRITMWLTDTRVLAQQAESPQFIMKNGYRTNPQREDIRILYTAELEMTVERTESPVGPIEISMPKLGRSDLLVFQILDFSRRFPYVRLADSALRVSALDEIMVVGYPLSRLENGMAIPQPSRGRVRRVGRELLEFDSPLHPGISGGPILNRQGRAIGLASAILDSPVYGVAVKGEDLRAAWKAVRHATRQEQARLKELGCDPGPIDGVPGKRTWEAGRCGAAQLDGDSGELPESGDQ